MTGSITTKKLDSQDFADNCASQSVVMPPEVEAGEPYGLSADIWALGQLHIQLLTEDKNRRDKSLGFLFKWNEKVPDSVKALCLRMVDSNPSVRPSITDMICHPWFGELE